MHLLAAKPGGFCDEEGIIDLQQTPADVIILSAQDTLINILADTAKHYFDSISVPNEQPDFTLRLANILHLTKPAAFDLYFESVLKHAKLIIVSLLAVKTIGHTVLSNFAFSQSKKILTLFLFLGMTPLTHNLWVIPPLLYAEILNSVTAEPMIYGATFEKQVPKTSPTSSGLYTTIGLIIKRVAKKTLMHQKQFQTYFYSTL